MIAKPGQMPQQPAVMNSRRLRWHMPHVLVYSASRQSVRLASRHPV
jgi:hypothetical protein